MSELSEAELYANLASLTGLTASKWSDILALPPWAQAIVFETYRDADWIRQTNTFSRVLDVLTALGNMAGAVSAIAALRAL